MGLAIDTGRSAVFEVMEPDSDPTDPSTARNALYRATPFTFLSSATTSTTVSGTTSAAAATDLVGAILFARDGNCIGQGRRIVSVAAGAPDVFTVETAFIDPLNNAAVAPTTITEWEVWNSPEALVVAASGTATTVVATAVADTGGANRRNEANDYFNQSAGAGAAAARYAMVGLSGANLGRAALITDWDLATVTFTILTTGMTWTGASAGDLFGIYKAINVMDGKVVIPDAPQKHVKRYFVGPHYDKQPGLPGPKEPPTVSMTIEVQPLATAASGATVAQPAHMAHDLLASRLDYDADGASLVTAGSTTSVVNITNAERSRFQVGNAIRFSGSGEAAIILDSGAGAGTEDILTVSPSLTVAPATGETVLGGCNYKVPTDLLTYRYRSHSLWGFLSGGPGAWHVHGWMPSVRLDWEAEGEIARLVFEGTAANYWDDSRSQPTWSTTAGSGRFVEPPVATAFLSRTARVSLAPTADGAATPAQTPTTFRSVVVEGLSLDFGITTSARRGLSGRDNSEGVQVTGCQPTGKIRLKMENMLHRTRYQAGSVQELFAQFDIGMPNGVVRTFVVFARRIQITEAKIVEVDGYYAHELAFEVVASGAVGESTAGAGTSITVPAASMHWI